MFPGEKKIFFAPQKNRKKNLLHQNAEAWKTDEFQIVLFCMQIISEALISINAWATLNAFNFQSQPAEE